MQAFAPRKGRALGGAAGFGLAPNLDKFAPFALAHPRSFLRHSLARQAALQYGDGFARQGNAAHAVIFEGGKGQRHPIAGDGGDSGVGLAAVITEI